MNDADPTNDMRAAASAVVLLCTVRECGEPLRRDGDRFACARDHAFDIARSGYCNLLQPQDRRSRTPGDSKAAVAARRRLLDAGHGAVLLDALTAMIAELDLAPRSAVLDVGCGEGHYLAALQERFDLDAWGIDISVAAIDAAARKHSSAHWLVVNADRKLPFADRSFRAILSITGRRNSSELRRVIAADGQLIVAVPAEDDQAELREALLGRATLRDRQAELVQEFAHDFEVEESRVARHTEVLSAETLRDLLATTYRGARRSAQDKLAEIEALEVTTSFKIVRFRRR